jgi:bifunctional non-homologous end joining protein LigD
LVFRLRGKRLHGRWALVRFHGGRDPERGNWLLIKAKDDQAEPKTDVTRHAATSVASGRDMEALATSRSVWRSKDKAKPKIRRRRRKRALPTFQKPELATLVDKLPDGKDWLFEVKFDGYRALAAVAGDHVRIYTRNGLDWTDRYPIIARALAALDLDGALLDGEVVALDSEDRSDFSMLQKALSEGGHGLNYFIFDLLGQGGKDLRNQPLIARKERLQKLLEGLPRSGPLAYSDHVVSDGREMYRTLCEKAFEGVIAKRTNSRYRSGRGHAWLKIKCHQEQEFVIVGWLASTKNRPFSSIILAQSARGKLRYAGRVGSGFSDHDLAMLAKQFKALAQRDTPLDGELPRGLRRGAHWVTPELVAEIAFAEFTGDGIVRQGRFLGLRQDKPAETIERERMTPLRQVSDNGRSAFRVGGVRLTHPDKVLYPAEKLTKNDVAEYLLAASERMLPHLANRPVSLLRYPDGMGKPGFFQRHAGPGFPKAIRRFPAEGKGNKKVEYLCIPDLQGLLAAAQVDVLEFHIWGVHADDMQHPDRIVFDLDPDPAVSFEAVRDGASHLRAALEALELASFPMLTGGKGVHVVVPIARRHTWPTVKQFAKGLAERFAEQMPDLYVATMRKSKRKGRIFIDHFRNELTASAVVPYSPRAREGAPVAWPVTWEALAKTKSANVVSLKGAAERLKEPDPWESYARIKQGLTAAALQALAVES